MGGGAYYLINQKLAMKNKVYIYGLCDVFYDAYYIQGLKKVYGNYSFNTSKFPKFNQGTFAVIIENNKNLKRIIIDSLDTNTIDTELLNWCDVYGKVNYNKNTLPINGTEKVMPIGPSFGIKIWNLSETLFNTFFNFLKFKKQIGCQREFVANYWRQFKRFRIEEYRPEKSSDNYVFFMNSIWKQEKKTNENRALFIEVCKANNKLNFEGGFASRTNGDNLGYDSLIYSEKIPLNIYLQKIKKSMAVFNTPAVLSCHGWKLGEFLALGKAIITTNHNNSLPSELIDEEHLLYANDAEEIKIAIEKLIRDREFKTKLEFNSRKYFEEYLAPAAVIKKLTT